MGNNRLFLLTGAAGFLGSNVSRELLARKERVRALVLPGDPAAKHIPAGVEVTAGNLLDTRSLDEFFRVESGVDIIVLHCASFVTVDPAPFIQKVYDVNVTGTENIIDKCLQYNVKKLVYVSSTGAIPELLRGKTIIEPLSFDPDKVRGCYSKTKAQATQLVLDAVHGKNLNASIVYPSGIFGPNDFSYGFVVQFVLDYVNGKMNAGIAGSLNSVDVRDLANGVIACAEKGRKGEGYILSNGITTIADIFRLVRQHTGAPEVKMIVPVGFARVLAFFAGIGGVITKKPVKLTLFSIYNLARNNNFSSEKAARELGYMTRPFEQTMQDTIAWLKQDGKITV